MLYFFGFLLLFLNFSIELSYGGTLNAIPDFLGYGLLLVASASDRRTNAHFRRQQIAIMAVLPFSVIKFVLALLPRILPTVCVLILDIAVTLASLYIAYEYAEGAKALEKRRYQKLDADKISAAWFILSMASLLQYLAVYLTSVALPCLAVYLLSIIWFESAVFGFERKRSQVN